jgi:hypothetical protein
VKAIEGATAMVPLREIGSLSGGDARQRVMIDGQVIRVEGLASAVKVSVGDETGEVVVYIWRNVLERIQQNAGQSRAGGGCGGRLP